MGCGLSKSSDSDSPKQKRHKASKRSNSISASDDSSEEVVGIDGTVDAKKAKVRISVTSTPVLNQTKVLSASQLDFFRELDQKIEQGQDLDPAQADQETRTRMALLLRHWDEVIHSRPGTTRPRPSSLASNYSNAVVANGGLQRAAPLPVPPEGAEDGRDPPRLERNVRSSRRSMRSARADSTEREPPASGGDGGGGGGALDDGQLVTKLIQLGDAYVHDLDADDPDSFVRLGRRSSNYEEPAIQEEAETGHARGQYGHSSLALRTMLDDSVR